MDRRGQRIVGGGVITDWTPEDVVAEIRVADAAARAARAVQGVARLQPGVWGLVRQLAAEAFERATGQDVPDIGGVQAELVNDGGVRVELQIVVDGGYQAAAVGRAVQEAVAGSVLAETRQPVSSVRVRIVEVVLDAT